MTSKLRLVLILVIVLLLAPVGVPQQAMGPLSIGNPAMAIGQCATTCLSCGCLAKRCSCQATGTITFCGQCPDNFFSCLECVP